MICQQQRNVFLAFKFLFRPHYVLVCFWPQHQCVLSTDLCYVRPWIICLKARISPNNSGRQTLCLKKSRGNIQPLLQTLLPSISADLFPEKRHCKRNVNWNLVSSACLHLHLWQSSRKQYKVPCSPGNLHKNVTSHTIYRECKEDCNLQLC